MPKVRAFVKNKEGLAKQELNQSPLPFIESAAQTGVQPVRLEGVSRQKGSAELLACLI